MVEVSVWRAVVPVWAREIERATLPLQVGYCLDRKSLPQHTTRCVSHSWLAIIKGRGNIDINSTMTTLHHRGDASYLVPTYKWRQADCLIVIPVHNSVIIQVWCWWGIDKKTTHLQHTWSGTTTGFHQWVFFSGTAIVLPVRPQILRLYLSLSLRRHLENILKLRIAAPAKCTTCICKIHSHHTGSGHHFNKT